MENVKHRLDPPPRVSATGLASSPKTCDVVVPLRRDDDAFAALSSGPSVGGRATRLAVIDPFADNEPMQRDSGMEFLYDAEDRDVVRMRRAGGPGPSNVWIEPDVWEVLPASKVTVPEAPAVLRAFC